jgi:hypothetical protein
VENGRLVADAADVAKLLKVIGPDRHMDADRFKSHPRRKRPPTGQADGSTEARAGDEHPQGPGETPRRGADAAHGSETKTIAPCGRWAIAFDGLRVSFFVVIPAKAGIQGFKLIIRPGSPLSRG